MASSPFSISEIIYVDDDKGHRMLAQIARMDAGLSTPFRLMESGKQFLSYLRTLPASDQDHRLVLLDINMHGLSGFDVLEALKREGLLPRVTVLMFSSSHSLSDRERAQALGAKRYFSKPDNFDLTVALFREVRELWMEPPETPTALSPPISMPSKDGKLHVLLVEDSEADAALLRFDVEDQIALHYVSTLGDARQRLKTGGIDCVLLDLGLPDASGLEGLRVLRTDWPDLPIVVHSGQTDPALRQQVLGEGAQDCLIKGELEAAALWQAVRWGVERQAMRNQLRDDLDGDSSLSLHDPLTGLPNHRALEQFFRTAITTQRNPNASLVLVLIDIDGLKPANVQYGHSTGDALLLAVTQCLQDSLGAGDLLGRVGGDTFAAIVMAPSAGDWTAPVRQRLHTALLELPPLAVGIVPALAALGAASAPVDGMDFETVLAAADHRMNEEKQRARAAFEQQLEASQEDDQPR